MKAFVRACSAAAIAVGIATSAIALSSPAVAQKSEVRYIVNNTPITSYDIQRRAAFLRLQRTKGDAGEQMIDQTLQLAEMQRLNIAISEQQVDEAYANFAKGNKLTTAQLDQIMAQAGVTSGHFKEYIRAQMGWGRVLQAKARQSGGSGGLISEQEAVKRILENGGQKPSTNEYLLQQVIFVVPNAQRSALLSKRTAEANALRSRFSNCESTRDQARGILDVTVRDLGRNLEPTLPADWAEAIKATRAGGTTPAKATDRGVEFIAVCSVRSVSDDRVAQLVFSEQDQKAAGGGGNESGEALSKKALAELREKAKIIKR
ncbi:SurA N-terminal domain-containing protein [Limoniibacter endophyticus]|uniref:Molecular chaperone SurA n=1 Tax=Limoniibacter endophyticus TaxID=1565040 RepID=A0A8J3DGS0_9HYPH|nr:SurA N-terminal domain-containing protein [Limoniibacter endophyticus]GHC68775.1 molecular chaperone SurA [Limoniibacter endophyticus]